MGRRIKSRRGWRRGAALAAVATATMLLATPAAVGQPAQDVYDLDLSAIGESPGDSSSRKRSGSAFLAVERQRSSGSAASAMTAGAALGLGAIIGGGGAGALVRRRGRSDEAP